MVISIAQGFGFYALDKGLKKLKCCAIGITIQTWYSIFVEGVATYILLYIVL